MKRLPALSEWRAALDGACEHVRREYRGLRFAPCPACGGGTTDTGWIKEGRSPGVLVGGCNSGCSFEDLARALFDIGGDGKGARAAPARRSVARRASVGGRAAPSPPEAHSGDSRTPDYSKGEWPVGPPPDDLEEPGAALLDTPDFPRFADNMVHEFRLGTRASLWLHYRGLDYRLLDKAGWRSIECGGDQRAVIDIAKLCNVALWRGWRCRPSAWIVAPQYSGIIEDGPFAGEPKAVGVRFRFLGKRGKWLALPGSDAELIAPPNPSPGDVLHVCEGETDFASLHQCGARAVGLPGATALHPAVASTVRESKTCKVATWLDGDDAGEAGRAGIERVLASIGGVSVVHVQPPPGLDVNDLLQRGELRGLVSGVSSAFEERAAA